MKTNVHPDYLTTTSVLAQAPKPLLERILPGSS